MEWRDTGFVLSARRHGENALIVDTLTAEHGRHTGLVRGGQSPRRRALLQPGNEIAVSWRGRLPEHLGTFECELVAPHAASLLDDPERLAALSAALALLAAALPEREPHPDLHAAFAELLTALSPASGADTPTPTLPRQRGRGQGGSGEPFGEEPDRGWQLHPVVPSPAGGGGLGWGYAESAAASMLPANPDSAPAWAEAYVLWECHLLAALGFGLDLGRCAVTGTNQDLAYVSPRTGRAVSRETGAPYHDKLLPLPEFLWRDSAARPDDIVAGLTLTRHFLLHHLLEPQGARLPEARERLLERMRRNAAAGMITR